MEAEQGGSILVRNEGGDVARFSVSYTLNGQSFTKDSGNFTLGVNASIAIPAGATDIHVKVEEMWGYGWSTIFTKNFDAPGTKCYKIYGTTLDPKWEETACEPITGRYISRLHNDAILYRAKGILNPVPVHCYTIQSLLVFGDCMIMVSGDLYCIILFPPFEDEWQSGSCRIQIPASAGMRSA